MALRWKLLLIYKLTEYVRKFKAFKGYFVLAQQSFKGFNQRKLTEDINKSERAESIHRDQI